jgi:hypothetical protein
MKFRTGRPYNPKRTKDGFSSDCSDHPRLTSGGSSPRFLTSVAQWQTARSLRVLCTLLLAYTCRIYVAAFRARIGLCIYWPAYPATPPLSASCSSGQRFAFNFLQIPPRGGHPCCSANTSPCRVCRKLSSPSKYALPGAPIGIGGAVTRSPQPHHPTCGSASGGSEGYARPSNSRGRPRESK